MGAAAVTSYPSAIASTGAKASASAAPSSGMVPVFAPSAAAQRNYGGILVAVAVVVIALFQM